MGAAANPYQQLRSVVTGAIVDCFKNHPDYLTQKGRKNAQRSLAKRVTGTVLSFAVQHTARGRSEAALTEPGDPSLSAPEAVGAITTSTALSPRTEPAAWFRPGYSRYHKSGVFACKTAQLQRAVETERLCFEAVSNALFPRSRAAASGRRGE